MCLAIPGKIIEVYNGNAGLRMAKVDFAGVVKEISIQWVEAGVGDYILAHAGAALSRIREKEALETLDLFRQMGELNDK